MDPVISDDGCGESGLAVRRSWKAESVYTITHWELTKTHLIAVSDV